MMLARRKSNKQGGGQPGRSNPMSSECNNL
jgi:hypothetical protein